VEHRVGARFRENGRGKRKKLTFSSVEEHSKRKDQSEKEKRRKKTPFQGSHVDGRRHKVVETR